MINVALNFIVFITLVDECKFASCNFLLGEYLWRYFLDCKVGDTIFMVQ